MGTMPIELSIPFSMLGSLTDIPPVQSALIGDTVRIETIPEIWIESVREQCPKVAAREHGHRLGEYTNRLYITLDPTVTSPLDITEAELQPLFRAIVLSHIVKPTPIAIDDVKVKTVHEQDGRMTHYCIVGDNNMTVALVSPHESDFTITEPDCQVMSTLWASFSEILEDSNSQTPRYSRIVRAIKNFEYAHYIYFANLSYLVYHSALEFLIYFGNVRRRQNRAQIVGRLPLLLPGVVSTQDATDIYDLNLHYKHGPEPSGALSLASSGDEVIRTMALLRESVRLLLLRALDDRSFADILVDHDLIKHHFWRFWERRNNNLSHCG